MATTSAVEKNGKLNDDQKDDFRDGKFFCITEDVWSVEYAEPKPEHWEAFWRKGKGDVVVQKGDVYAITRKALRAGERPAPVKSTRSNSVSGNADIKKGIWPVDIFGHEANDYQEIAHLLPAGYKVHEEWFGVAAAVTGLPKTASVIKQLMATRGVRKEYPNDDDKKGEMATSDGKSAAAQNELPNPGGGTTTRSLSPRRTRSEGKRGGSKKESNTNSPPPQKSKRMKGSESEGPPAKKGKATMEHKKSNMKTGAGTELNQGRVSFENGSIASHSTRSSAARKQRVDSTGVVHFVFNKIRLRLQQRVVDGVKPSMLIVPCMSLQDATNNWNGQGYKAVVLCGFPQGLVNVPAAFAGTVPAAARKKFAWQAMNAAADFTSELREKYENSPKISQEDKADWLEKARMGLEQAVLGLSEFVKELKNMDLKPLQPSNQYLLSKRSEEFRAKNSVPVPKSLPVPEKAVLFVDFGNVGQSNIHPPPDPTLLLAKAATVWGMLNDITILANGTPEDEEDIDILDEEAEEVYYDSFRGSTSIPNEISVVTPVQTSTTR
ncbi:expressed unknown protein [Seminavis robusta]|uniref:Uncharacterized protein n=1 Tax=Seminavis robusta TaxID=568900 RepID=A0A9N8HBG8_9STRA|nr:expressed unknown protein [Seminavis robusta]|eukprot:Sro337_g120720.1 n/a (550) ;mRNA; r:61164-62813